MSLTIEVFSSLGEKKARMNSLHFVLVKDVIFVLKIKAHFKISTFLHSQEHFFEFLAFLEKPCTKFEILRKQGQKFQQKYLKRLKQGRSGVRQI